MEDEARQRADYDEHVASQRRKGACEFSGLRITECVESICDCFETIEGARIIEAEATEPLVPLTRIQCSSACDDDCDATCHEGHQVPHHRVYDFDECVARLWAE